MGRSDNEIRIGPADEALWRALFYQRLATTYQLAALLGRDPAAIRRRCGQLERAGLLARPPLQFAHPAINTDRYQPLRALYDPHCPSQAERRPLDQDSLPRRAQPAIWALSTAAASEIAERCGVKSKGRRYNWNNRRLKDYYELAHTLQITDFLLALDKAVGERGDSEMIRQAALTPFAPFRFKDLALSYKGRFGRFVQEPDALFKLQEQGNASQRLFFLEIDCGSMPIAREDIFQASIRRKIWLYDVAARRRLAQPSFGAANFHTLIVTTRPKRADDIAAMIARESRRAGQYRVADLHFLRLNGPLGAVWRDPRTAELGGLPLAD